MTKTPVDIRSLARAHTEAAIRTLAVVMTKARQPSARALAANSLLDRGWGKAPQQLTGEDGGDIRITIRQIITNAVETEPELIEHIDGEDKTATG